MRYDRGGSVSAPFGSPSVQVWHPPVAESPRRVGSALAAFILRCPSARARRTARCAFIAGDAANRARDAANRARDRQRGGAGIGLAIVKRLVEDVGGRVGATSDEAWTTFWFRLPASG